MSRFSRRDLIVGGATCGFGAGLRQERISARHAAIDSGLRTTADRRGTGLRRQALTVDDPLSRLDSLLDNESGAYGLIVVDAQGHMRYSRNARLPFISASLYKLILATEILRQIEGGELQWEQLVVLEEGYFPPTDNYDGAYGYDMIGAAISIDEALWATICVSSNIAALALLQLTTPESMNTLSRSLGLVSTNFASNLAELDFWPPSLSAAESPDQLSMAVSLIESASLEWNVNLTSPADMTRFTQAVLQKTLLSEFVSSELLRLLLAQEINDRIPALLPPGTRIAHKTGNLTSIIHDTGAIFCDEGPILMTLMSQAVPDEYHTIRLFQSIAAMIYADFLER